MCLFKPKVPEQCLLLTCTQLTTLIVEAYVRHLYIVHDMQGQGFLGDRHGGEDRCTGPSAAARNMQVRQ